MKKLTCLSTVTTIMLGILTSPALAGPPSWTGNYCAADRPTAQSYPNASGYSRLTQTSSKKTIYRAPPSTGKWICGDGYSRALPGRVNNRPQSIRRQLAGPACSRGTPECAATVTAKFICSTFHADTPQVQSFEIWKGRTGRNYLYGYYLNENATYTGTGSQIHRVICQEYCSPWSKQALQGSIGLISSNSSSQFSLKYSSNSAIDAEMVQYAGALTNEFEDGALLKIYFTLKDHGDGTQASTKGAPVRGKFIQSIGYSPTQAYSGGFSFPNYPMVLNRWYRLETSVVLVNSVNRKVGTLGATCNSASFYYRVVLDENTNQPTLIVSEDGVSN